MKQKNHEFYIRQALLQAQKAFELEEVPIGAIIVDESGKIIARAYNKMESICCQTGHAEVLAIQKACKKIGDWRLNDCWLYVTAEPCPMCFGLAQLSRLRGIVYGCRSPQFGFESNKIVPLSYIDMIIQGGILETKCSSILQDFFEKIRIKTKG